MDSCNKQCKGAVKVKKEIKTIYVLCAILAVVYITVLVALGIYALNHPQVEAQKQYDQIQEEVINDLIEYLEGAKVQGNG